MRWRHKIALRDLLSDGPDSDSEASVQRTMLGMVERLRAFYNDELGGPTPVGSPYSCLVDELGCLISDLETAYNAGDFVCADFNEWLSRLYDLFDSEGVWVKLDGES